ncbi:MAG: nucleoside deaminase [Planctomycetes bacterium]|nr:nucleoside deaminase [Planctomycetota bacterium]
MREAIALSLDGCRRGLGGPFGAVIVKDGHVVGRGQNRVLADNDPTAHAEMVAIREAAATLGSFSLEGCVLYTSCEPCPMCLGGAYWSRVDRIVFANGRADAAAIGFDDAFFYDELGRPPAERSVPMEQRLRDEALVAFAAWDGKPDKTSY